LKDNYTDFARRYTFKHPIRSFVGVQFTFWIFANLLLGIIFHLQSLLITEIYPLPQIVGFRIILIVAIIFGLFYGTVLGLCDYYLDKSFFKNHSLGKLIILKVAISFIVLTVLIAIIKYIIAPLFFGSFFNTVSFKQNNKFWHLLFALIAVYYFFMSLLINFINQVNKKYGPGVLIPLLLGKYRSPREEEKIFMFMDLNASTTIAEKLGHLKYSEFIRDSFQDINLIVSSFNAEIYQYVGDEIVLTWQLHDGMNNLSCLRFFFECERKLQERKEHYLANYGTIPSFKAGVHLGKVTVVEIGDIKRDIAYHGDTLNTTARILSLCNEYQKKILISDNIFNYYNNDARLVIERLGKIKLRGKEQEVEIASIQNTSVMA
jgi:adenylate cyclase